MINLSITAAEKIKQHLQSRGSGLGIRIGVKTTGCSGLAYVLEFVDKIQQDDVVFTQHDVNIYINSKHCDILLDLDIDWVTEGLNSGFKFTNPLEQDRCGCGQSFRI